MELVQLTRPVDPTKQTDELLMPKPKRSLLEQVSTTYLIKYMMGHDLPSPAKIHKTLRVIGTY